MAERADDADESCERIASFLDEFASDDEPEPRPPRPPPPPFALTAGAPYSKPFVSTAGRAFTPRFGAENFAPLLYSLVRFSKPRRIVEIGSGYTSIWLLQAIADNDAELTAAAAAVAARGDAAARYLVGLAPGGRARRATLTCVDSEAHEHETASEVRAVAAELGLERRLKYTVGDALDPAGAAATAAAVAASDGGADDDGADGDGADDGGADDDRGAIDFLVADFGAADRLETFWALWWPRVACGGHVVVHSTLTNELSRRWLEEKRAALRQPGGGGFEALSMLEPHKRLQNSFSIFQKREGAGWPGEPVYTRYP